MFDLPTTVKQAILRDAWTAHQQRIAAGEDFLASRARYYAVFDSI